MPIEALDGSLLYRILENGYRNLRRNMTVIDDLNVFPVPDGDTGKNMTMTIEGGIIKAKNRTGMACEIMQDIASGTLLSARGNSGVILSQFVRGLASGMPDHAELTTADFVVAMHSGVEKAYDAVANPVEGTMLTVMREGAESLDGKPFDSFENLFEHLIHAMKVSLRHTPELLPVLKEAGVVDSGGAGLICIFEGIQMGLAGEWIEEDAEPIATYNSSLFTEFDPDSLLEYGYCTEFILQIQPSKVDLSTLKVQDIIEKLSDMGDSIVAVLEQTILKVHIHSFEPERVLGFARTMGEFLTIKIENMSVQHSETVAPKKDPVKYAVVATASGEGIIDYFKQIGAAAVIDGGQTNNPSSQDFLTAFETLNAEHIIVLPNDSNIILAANQAAQMYDKSDVRVIPTKSIAEGYSALSMMDLSYDSVEAVIEEMSAYLPDVTTGYVTTATRDAEIDGVAIGKGHFIGLTPKHIYCDGTDKIDVAMALFAAIPEMADKQVMTVFVGKDVTPAEQDRFSDAFSEAYPLMEIGFIEGDQDVYSFIFAIE